MFRWLLKLMQEQIGMKLISKSKRFMQSVRVGTYSMGYRYLEPAFSKETKAKIRRL